MPYEVMDAMMDAMGWDEAIYEDEDAMNDWDEYEDPRLYADLDEDEEEEYDDSVDESHYNPYLGCDDWDL